LEKEKRGGPPETQQALKGTFGEKKKVARMILLEVDQARGDN